MPNGNDDEDYNVVGSLLAKLCYPANALFFCCGCPPCRVGALNPPKRRGARLADLLGRKGRSYLAAIFIYPRWVMAVLPARHETLRPSAGKRNMEPQGKIIGAPCHFVVCDFWFMCRQA